MPLARVLSLIVSSTFVSLVTGVMYFEDIQCNSSNKTASSNYSCYINQKGTKNENVNLEATAVVAVDNAMVFFEISYRKNVKDPQIVLVKVSDQEICRILSKMDHPALRWFLQKVGESLEKQIHPCPYHGHVKFLNITVRQIGGFSPAGLYKVYIKFMNNEDENLFEATINLKIVYPRKGK